MELTVDARGIAKSYGGVRVLDGVDLQVRSGSVLALLGPNGAGKTTMVRILATLLRPDSGSATVAGHDLLGEANLVRGAISLTGQYAAVDQVLTGAENLALMARLHHLPRVMAARRRAELLAEFDLVDAADRRVATYSGGMRRRLDLAVSLVGRPQLLILDEPTTGLDPRSRDAVWAVIRALVADGTTVLLTTQYLEEADRLADRIVVLDHGRVVAEGTADELKSSVGGEVVRLYFPRGQDRDAALLSLGSSASKDADPECLVVSTGGSVAELRTVLATLDAAAIDVERLALERPSLDDVFLTLTADRPLQGASR